jgi:hypothetical protein
MGENIFLKDLAHFRLSNGSELICEVVEWAEQNESDDIIARNGMAIVPAEYDGERIYVFRPWMHYIESNNEFFVINPNHIIGTARPNDCLVREYKYAVSEMHLNAKYRSDEYDKQIESSLKVLEEAILKLRDSDRPQKETNVIVFPSKDDTVH